MGKKIALFVLLAALITFAILQSVYIGNATDNLLEKLSRLEYALNNSPSDTIPAADDYMALWEQDKYTFEALFEHNEVDMISSTSNSIASFCASSDKVHALAEIAALKHYIKHIRKIDAVRWENIF